MVIRSIAYGGYYAKPKPNTKLPLLARDYLSTLYATCTDKNELEMKTVINYLNELITEDELRGASRL